MTNEVTSESEGGSLAPHTARALEESVCAFEEQDCAVGNQDCAVGKSVCAFKLSVCAFKLSVCAFKLSVCAFKVSVCAFKVSDCAFKVSDCAFKDSDCVFKVSVCIDGPLSRIDDDCLGAGLRTSSLLRTYPHSSPYKAVICGDLCGLHRHSIPLATCHRPRGFGPAQLGPTSAIQAVPAGCPPH